MNPTEKFINSLIKLLCWYERETGAYIKEILIYGVKDKDCENIRAKRIITKIKLVMGSPSSST